MATSVVQPADRSLHETLALATLFAVLKLIFQIAVTVWQVHLGYGYFRDEFYYIACGRHLAWGYVDHGPLVAIQALLATTLFGKSLVGIRMLSALAGAGRVFLTGILCWALGGKRPAQGLAMVAVTVPGIYLSLDGFLSMNSFESLFWMTCLLALIMMCRPTSARPKLWLLWGLSAGIGLLNKPSMTFFLVALLIALLLTPQRRLLLNRWAAAGVAVMFLIVLPNLLWQIHNHWPTYEFLHNGQMKHKNVALGPVDFLVAQVVFLQPLNIIVWAAGLIFLLRNALMKPFRWIGLTYLFFLAINMVLHAKDYYLSPIYPILFAAGGMAWERRFADARRVMERSAYAFPILETVLLAAALIFLPMSQPVIKPEQFVAYTKVLPFLRPKETETTATGPLPQFFADRFGWQEEVDIMTRAYNGLSPDERSVACLWGSNYGEAGALDFLGRGLPPAINGQNNYFLWGPRGCTGKIVISVTPTSAAELKARYDSIELVGHLANPWSMPYEHRNIYILRGRKGDVVADWPKFKEYF